MSYQDEQVDRLGTVFNVYSQDEVALLQSPRNEKQAIWVERLLSKRREVPISNPGRDTDYSETRLGCFTQSLHVNNSTVPLHGRAFLLYPLTCKNHESS